MIFNSNLFASAIRIAVLFALFVACTLAVIYFGLAPALFASIISASAFFITILCIQQFQMAQVLAQLRSQTTGIAEFEKDILRRIEAPAAGANRAETASPAGSITNEQELLNKIAVLQERLQAVEKNSGTGFQNVVSPAPMLRKASKSTETTSTGVLAKPKALSRINLKNAIAGGGLSLHLQPIVDLPNRQR